MSKNPQDQMEIGRSSRGGINSSRAQRLSEKIETNKKSSGKWVYALSGVSVLAVLAFVYGATEPSSPGAGNSASDDQVSNSVAAFDIANAEIVSGNITEPDVQTPSQQTDAVMAENGKSDLQPAALSTSEEQFVALVPEPSGSIACVAVIETNLDALEVRSATSEDVPWSFKQDEVTKLVQSVLDCPEARFEVNGSLELLELGLSDLEVRWNQAERYLALRTVSTELGVSDALSENGDDAQPDLGHNFILR